MRLVKKCIFAETKENAILCCRLYPSLYAKRLEFLAQSKWHIPISDLEMGSAIMVQVISINFYITIVYKDLYYIFKKKNEEKTV